MRATVQLKKSGIRPVKKESLKVPRRRSTMQKKRDLQYFILMIPGLIKIVIFSLVPIIGLLIAFQRYIPRLGLFGSPYVGLANLELLFTTSVLKQLLINTSVLTLLQIFFGVLTSVSLALIIFEIRDRAKVRILQIFLLFPYFISWPLVGMMVQSLLNSDTGMITHLVMNLTGEKIEFYAEPKYWRFILTFAACWKSIGINGILYYAVLIGVDKGLYEAASLDGASTFRKMWHISLPALSMMVCLGIITSSAGILRYDFSLVYYLTNNRSELLQTTEVIEVYMFNTLRTTPNFPIGSAVGLFQSVFGFILSIIANLIVKKINGDSALF